MSKKPMIPMDLEEGLAAEVAASAATAAEGQGAKPKFALDDLDDVPVRLSRNIVKTIHEEAAAAGFRNSRPKKIGRPSVGRTAQVTLKVRPAFVEILEQLRQETTLGFNVLIEQAVCEKFGFDLHTLQKKSD